MDIIQGLVQAGSTAGRPALRIVSNNQTFDVVNTVTSGVIFSILNDGSVGAGSTIYTNLITNYADSGSSSSGGSTGGSGTSTGVSSQWTTVGTKIYYNLGNIGIGATDPIAPLHIYNATNARLLLDTTTTGTATLEFRRGTGGDAQNDFRFINDSNSSFKLQCENLTQVFGNAIADLAWFSSNETIIHKNTTMNGRVGVGTVYHATRTLDVVGDANVFGTASAGNLNISSSNSVTITNTITSNTTLTIGNTSLPILITPATGYITTTAIEGTPSVKYQTETFTFNQGNVIAYYKFNNSSSLGLDSNPSSTKYNLTPTIVGGTGGYNSNIAIEGGSLQATNDGDRLEGDFPLKSIYDNSTTGISVSCWFYKKLATYDNIYNTRLFYFHNPSDTFQGVIVTLSHYNNIYRANLSFSYISGETYCSGFGPIIAFDTWYHLVLVFTKSGTIKVYLNGADLNLVVGTTDGTIRWYGSSAYPLPQCPNTTKLKIYDAVGSGAFSGNIDEFYVFNKELTQTEITNLYNKTYSLPNNTWNINFPTSTPVIINNGASQNVTGNYTVSVSNNSSVIPAGGQLVTPYPSTAITTVAIKYATSTSSTATINLIRGTVTDANHDYRVGNYNGEFKVISSVSSQDTDYIRITTAGAITNPTGTASWNTGSDRRIKENIERASYDKCYENINKLELNRFNYVSGFNTVNRDKTQLGFIAQEVNVIFPKAISSQEYYTNELCIPDLLSIDITQINYSLYGAVKKLIKINENYETKMETFDRRLKTIETALNIVTEPATSNITVESQEPATSNITVESQEPATSNIIVDIIEPSTSNIIVDIIEPATSNIIVDIIEPATSNIIVDIIVPATSNLATE